jgi:uracil-DNA glycosylase
MASAWTSLVSDFPKGEWFRRLSERCDLKRLLDEISNALDPLWATGEAHPPRRDVFNAFRLTTFETIKVVIVGNEPYPNAGDATGLASSAPSHVQPAPRSLDQVFDELDDDRDFDLDLPSHGDLTCCTDQGVLLLSCALTFGSPRHVKLWKPFTDCVIELLDELEDPVVFSSGELWLGGRLIWFVPGSTSSTARPTRILEVDATSVDAVTSPKRTGFFSMPDSIRLHGIA